MQAVLITEQEVSVSETDQPIHSDTELLVKVASAGLNGADLLQVKGNYPPPPGYRHDIPGLELAGVVVEAGAAATRFKVGDRVMGIVGGAAQAEYAIIEDAVAMRVPDEVDITMAGGFPEVFTTSYDALILQAGLTLGDRVCVHGAAGGVGLAAIQLAVAAGAEVIATTRNTEHRDDIAGLGATVITPEEFANSGDYDVILELVGAPNMSQNLNQLRIGGRIVVIGVGAGARFEIDLRLMMAKRSRILASTLRARSVAEKATITRAMESHVVPLLRAGRLQIHEHASFPLTQAPEAYNSFARGGKLGKVILFNA